MNRCPGVCHFGSLGQRIVYLPETWARCIGHEQVGVSCDNQPHNDGWKELAGGKYEDDES